MYQRSYLSFCVSYKTYVALLLLIDLHYFGIVITLDFHFASTITVVFGLLMILCGCVFFGDKVSLAKSFQNLDINQYYSLKFQSLSAQMKTNIYLSFLWLFILGLNCFLSFWIKRKQLYIFYVLWGTCCVCVLGLNALYYFRFQLLHQYFRKNPYNSHSITSRFTFII